MKKGFTLIELVIVIVILGILAAVAVPKFANLQSDARKGALKGLQGAVNGAATIGYAKFSINNQGSSTDNDNITIDGVNVKFRSNGYPAATSDGIIRLLDNASGDLAAGIPSGDNITIYFSGYPSNCNVWYKNSNSTTEPKFQTGIVDSGC